MTEAVRDFPHSLHTYTGIVAQGNSLPSVSFPVRYSSILLLELLTESLHKPEINVTRNTNLYS
jgi:hypothetical protein